MFKFLKNSSFLKNLISSFFLLFLLCFSTLKFLDIYTEHNDSLKVPDFEGLHISEIDSFVNFHQIRYEIIDSVFDQSRARGSVVNQYPIFQTNVKRNRKVFLTINSIESKLVSFPDIFDLTLRQAVNSLKNDGFEIGNLVYKSDMAINKILACKINGMHIKVGQNLRYGSIIDLLVSKGLSNEKVILPNLIGLSKFEANIILKTNSLNFGLEYYKGEIVDSNSALIYRQYPSYNLDKEVNIGSSVDLYFKKFNKVKL